MRNVLPVKFTLTVMRILVIACIPLTIASSGLQGLVACFGTDGSFALEAGDETGCFCPSDDHGATGETNSHASFSPDADRAQACVCVSFSTDWRHSLSGSEKRDNSPRESVPQPSSQPAFDLWNSAAPVERSVSLQSFQPATPFFRLALRTIVLLT